MPKSGHAFQILVSVTAVAMMVLFAGAAVALSTGDYVGKTETEITKSLEQQGYKVNEIEREEGNLEADVVLDGKPYEIYTDPRTGKIVEIEEGDEGNEGSLIRRLFGIGNE